MSFNISIGPNIRKSPYFDATVAAGVACFSVYNHMYIPAHYGDPDAEYRCLMEGVAIWDVGAQRQVEIAGPDATALVNYLSARDIADTCTGQGRYLPICDYDGYLINDPVALKLAEDRYWLSIADSDIELWAKAIASERRLRVRVSEPDVSPLAVQGPKAEDLIADLFGDWIREIRYFWFRETAIAGIPLVLARSGWSKQGGFELYLMDGVSGIGLWDMVCDAGSRYGIGPGAPNDLERIESGLLSYGADARRQTHPSTPFDLGLARLVDLDREADFVGKAALVEIAARGAHRERVGFVIDSPALAASEHPLEVRHGDSVVGIVSEMCYSAHRGVNIGIGLLDAAVAENGTGLSIDYRGQTRSLRLVELPLA